MPASPWNPIATAPKDDFILIARESGRICIAKYDNQSCHQKPNPFWNDYGCYGVNRMRDDAPTHWMSLPELP